MAMTLTVLSAEVVVKDSYFSVLVETFVSTLASSSETVKVLISIEELDSSSSDSFSVEVEEVSPLSAPSFSQVLMFLLLECFSSYSLEVPTCSKYGM